MNRPGVTVGYNSQRIPIIVEKKKVSPYSPEFRERAVRMLEEHRSAYPTPAMAYREIAAK